MLEDKNKTYINQSKMEGEKISRDETGRKKNLWRQIHYWN